MKISLNWLKDYCRWNWSTEELIEQLTMSGTEVEHVTEIGRSTPGVITAQIVSFRPHPNADRLRLCEVFDGKTTLQIVCGAKNFKEKDIALLATAGTTLPNGMTIQSTKMRGERSDGMLCSASELGLNLPCDGILILDPTTPVGKPMSEIFESDTILELEVTYNRTDLLSYRGMAREFFALGAELTEQFTLLSSPSLSHSPSKTTPSSWNVKLEDIKASPRYTASLLENVRVAQSPEWLQKKLQTIGIKTINNVVDITNFVLLEMGQPLHAFDADQISGDTLHVRYAHQGETLDSLDGKTRTLTPEDLVIADKKGPVALAGVIGGVRTSVTENTRRVLLESASFQPVSVRQSSRRHLLTTDAAFRFERPIDPALVDQARNRASALICELTGAVCQGVVMQSSEYKADPITVPLREERFERMIGANISTNRIDEILTRLGCKKESSKKEISNWQIPSWRPDLTREIDLIEELIRIEGLHILKPKLQPQAAPFSGVDRIHDRNYHLRELLTHAGFYEAMTSSLVPRDGNVSQTASPIQLINPMTEDHVQLRTELLPTLLPCVAHNLAHGQRNIRLFEIGKVYRKEGSNLIEETRLGIVATGNERDHHWTENARPFDFFSLKGLLEEISSHFPEISLPAEENYGYLPANLLKAHGIKAPLLGAELILHPPSTPPRKRFKPMAQYPAITRDLTFVVPRTMQQRELLKQMEKMKKKNETLESIECFDLFTDPKGVKLDSHLKSLTYRFVYRANDRTLKESEVEGWEKELIDSVCKETGALLRS